MSNIIQFGFKLGDRACAHCGAAKPPVVIAFHSNHEPPFEEFWCSIDHAKADGWPWLKPASKPKGRRHVA